MQVLTQVCLGWASAHGWLDKAMQCTFMKVSWTTSLSFVLTFYSLSEYKITDKRVCALVRELQVNQSHQKLEWVQPFMSNFLRGACWDCYTEFLTEGGFPPPNLEMSMVIIVLSQVLNNNLVPDCIRSNLRGSKFKIFLGAHAPRPP